MEFIFDVIFDLIFDSSKNSKVPKPIRYFFIFLVILIIVGIIGMIVLFGIDTLNDSLVGGILVLLIAIILVIVTIVGFRNAYLSKKKI